MRRFLLFLLAAGCAGSAHVAGPTADPVRVQLLAFNDFHGYLEPPPATARPPDAGVPIGGVAWLATHVARLRQQEPATLVVAAGDLVGASPLASALTHDEPSIAALDALGLDVSSVGNHEFDEGVEELRRLQRGGCHAAEPCPDGPFAGARFSYLAANVLDRTGATIFPGTLLKQVGGATVGFIGIVLRDTPTLVTPSGIAGLTFLDEADTVNALVPRLRAAGADAVVVLIHQGATPAPGSPPDACRGVSGPLVELAQRFRGVDVVVSGHTHQVYVCPDLGGALVTSAGAYGRFLTRISLELDPVQHRVLSRTAVQVPVTHDLPPEAQVQALVDRAVARAAPLAQRPVGRLTARLSRSGGASGESPLGDVVADAHLAATRDAQAALAFTNSGGLRADLPAGTVTFGDVFSAQPFGNTLVTVTMTGAQLVEALEQQWTGSRPRILQPSANVHYSWSESASVGARVVAGSVRVDGRAVEATARYRVTVNSFLAQGGDGFEAFTRGTERVGGPPDSEALVEYLRPSLSGAPFPPPASGRIAKVP
jgi:5'-nucleotidase